MTTPAWWRPGMTAQEAAMWEAAQRAANEAPEIAPDSDLGRQIRALFEGFPGRVRARRAAAVTVQDTAA